MSKTSHQDLLTRRVADILPSADKLNALLGEHKIRLYQGFDPSAQNLHIGHVVGLLQLRAFQDAGHEVIFLIGDFTGMIGDPTDKSSTRPVLTHEEVLKNAETYKEQAGKFLRFEGDNAAKIMFNHDWNSKLNFADVLELASNLTVQQLLERDMFQARLKEGKPIHVHEFLYPLIQGYDSVEMEVDLEVGGNDQMFNMMVGRTLLKSLKGKEKFVLTTKLLTDSAGEKIGKTTGNAINLFGNPNDLYGGVMSVPDDTIESTFTLATDLDLDEISSLVSKIDQDPMTIKKRLAWELTRMCHNKEAADKAQTHFQNTVQDKQAPNETPEISVQKDPQSFLSLLKSLDLEVSSGQLKRTIEQGGVELAGKKITDFNQEIVIKGGEILKFGKRTYRKLVI